MISLLDKNDFLLAGKVMANLRNNEDFETGLL